MKHSTVKSFVIISLAIVILTFLFIQTRSSDIKNHQQIVLNIQQLSYKDSRLNEFVLKNSADQFSNYDPLIQLKTDVQQTLAWFKGEEADIYGVVNNEMDAAIDEAEANLKIKLALIERFKSHNGILKNSLYYTPTAVEYLHQDAALSNHHKVADKLLQDIFLYNSRLNQQHKERGKKHIAYFRSQNITRLDEISIHAETVFRERKLLKELTDQLFAIPSKHSIEMLYKQYSRYNAKSLAASSMYRAAMYLMALLLLAYVLHLYVTLRKARLSLENSLHEVEFQRNALDQHALVTSINANGVITYANDKFIETTQYSEAEIVGMPRSVLESKMHEKAFFDNMWKDLESGQCWRGEIQNLKKDNTEYWVEATVVPFLNKQNKPIRYVALLNDITKKKQAETHNYRLAHYDALTGLPNRAMFLENLENAMPKAAYSQEKLAVLFIDLDNFKFINDTMGHASGDELLQTVAEHLRASVRESDLVARLGGDEFTIVMPNIDSIAQVESIAKNILSITKKSVDIGNNEIFVSSSIGVSVFPDDASDSDTLLKNADIAMYQAKASGKNNCVIFNNNLKDNISVRHALENDLQIAVRQEQFVLHYQPQIETTSGKIVSAEALIRWNHPDKGLIYPNDFIPVLEETGLIIDVGKWVLQEACSQLEKWKNAGFDLGVAVNVTARQLQDNELLELMTTLLRSPNLQPSDIEFELTETSLFRQTDELIQLLTTFNNLGIQLSLDDFGTGYSSLSHLKKLPLSKLKIDRSFIQDIPFDKHDMAIADTVMAMARSLDLNVVAEGVETAAQIEFLEANGCDYLQGNYVSKPVDADTLQQLLKHRGDRGSDRLLKKAQ